MVNANVEIVNQYETFLHPMPHLQLGRPASQFTKYTQNNTSIFQREEGEEKKTDRLETFVERHAGSTAGIDAGCGKYGSHFFLLAVGGKIKIKDTASTDSKERYVRRGRVLQKNEITHQRGKDARYDYEVGRGHSDKFSNTPRNTSRYDR